MDNIDLKLIELFISRNVELIKYYNGRFDINNFEMSDFFNKHFTYNANFAKDVLSALLRFLYEECLLENYLETKTFRVFNYPTSKGTVAFIVNGQHILMTMILDNKIN